MLTILGARRFCQMLKFECVLLLLMVLSGCSQDRDLPKPAKVTQIQFKENLLTVAVGKSAELKVVHLPSELSPPGYEWSVSDAGVARVEGGMVYGLKVGETEVSVSAKGLGLTSRTTVRVIPVLPQALHLHGERTSLLPGEETLLTYTVDPPEVTDPDKLEIEWSSSDETVCKVSGGKVLAMGAGATDIVAQIKGTAISGSLRLHVAPVAVKSVSLNIQQTTVSVGEGTRLIPGFCRQMRLISG